MVPLKEIAFYYVIYCRNLLPSYQHANTNIIDSHLLPRTEHLDGYVYMLTRIQERTSGYLNVRITETEASKI